MDNISYLLEAVRDVVRVLDRLLNTSNGERDFQLLISEHDYLRRIGIDGFVMEMIRRADSLMVEMERVSQSECGGYRASVRGGGTRGRPSFDMSKEKISFFSDQGFKVKDISAMLGVSVRTVERRIATFGLCISGIMI